MGGGGLEVGRRAAGGRGGESVGPVGLVLPSDPPASLGSALRQKGAVWRLSRGDSMGVRQQTAGVVKIVRVPWGFGGETRTGWCGPGDGTRTDWARNADRVVVGGVLRGGALVGWLADRRSPLRRFRP